MLHLMPRHTPEFGPLLSTLHASPEAAARALGVSPRSVYRWCAAGSAPRSAALALWWLTPAGWSLLDSELGHRLHVAHATADALRAELTAERAQVARLLRLGYRQPPAPAPAANAPRWAGWR